MKKIKTLLLTLSFFCSCSLLNYNLKDNDNNYQLRWGTNDSLVEKSRSNRLTNLNSDPLLGGTKGSSLITPTAIDLNTSSIKLELGNTYQLNVMFTPSNTSSYYTDCTFISSNSDIAEVTSTGLITAYGYGSATIAVTSKYNSLLSKECIVYVYDPTVDEYYENIDYDYNEDNPGIIGDLKDNENCDLFSYSKNEGIIRYNCHYCMSSNTFEFTISLLNINWLTKTFSIEIKPVIKDNGEIDETFIYNDKQYVISDFTKERNSDYYSTDDYLYDDENNNVESNNLVGAIIVISVTVVAAIIIAVNEIIYAVMVKRNYSHNKELDNTIHGVRYDRCIVTQNEIYNSYDYSCLEFKDCTSYKIGNFSVIEKGCGAIALHNLYVSLGIIENFADTIKFIEKNKLLIHYGTFGTNPYLMHQALDNHGLVRGEDYFKYSKYDSIKTKVDSMNKSRFIIAAWNSDNLSDGAHYFFTIKEENVYYIYNNGRMENGQPNKYTKKDFDEFYSAEKMGKLIYAYVIEGD